MAAKVASRLDQRTDLDRRLREPGHCLYAGWTTGRCLGEYDHHGQPYEEEHDSMQVSQDRRDSRRCLGHLLRQDRNSYRGEKSDLIPQLGDLRADYDGHRLRRTK